MGQRQRKRSKGVSQDAKGARAAGSRRTRRPIIPWRERARDVLAQLREFARERQGDVIEAHLQQRFANGETAPDLSDLQVAFDDFVCVPGSAGDERSLVRVFSEEAPDLDASERERLANWEKERTRRVYLLDRGHRDRMDLWDPITEGRVVVHLIEKMPPVRAAALRRGTVVVATSAPWVRRRVVLGPVEMYEDDEAIEMFRKEVREGGRMWHDLPPATPLT